MTKMIFAVHNLMINTKKHSVNEISSFTTIHDFNLTPWHNVNNDEILSVVKNMAKELIGSTLFDSPWMNVEYISNDYITTVRYRLYGDANEEPEDKIFDRVLIITVTPLTI